jgi:hypothetical protein
MAMGQAAVAELELAPLLARGLAILELEDLTEGNLTLELGLSLWMRRTNSDLYAVLEALMALRDVLLEASGMDRRTEPVPLLAGDCRTAVLGLAIYIRGLVMRAANATSSSRREVVEEALAIL